MAPFDRSVLRRVRPDGRYDCYSGRDGREGPAGAWIVRSETIHRLPLSTLRAQSILGGTATSGRRAYARSHKERLLRARDHPPVHRGGPVGACGGPDCRDHQRDAPEKVQRWDRIFRFLRVYQFGRNSICPFRRRDRVAAREGYDGCTRPDEPLAERYGRPAYGGL